MKKDWKFFLLFVALIPCVGIGLRPSGDFGIYSSVGHFLNGPTPQFFYSTEATKLFFFYGVPFLPLTKFFTFLPLPETYWIWLSFQILAYMGFWYFLFQLFPALLEEKTCWAFLLVWAFSIKPIHASFQSANVQLMFAALLGAAEYLTSQKQGWKQGVGGALITPLVLFKIYPLYLLIAYLFLKSRHVLGGMVLSGLFWLLLPLAVYGMGTGIQLYNEYLSHITHFHSPYSLGRMAVNLSLPSLVSYWFLFLGDTVSNRIALATSSLLSLAFLAQLIKAKIKKVPWNSSWWAYTLAVMTLLNSGARPDYFVFYVPAFAAMAQFFATQRMPKWFPIPLFMSFALIALISEWTLGSRELGHAMESMRIPVFGMVLLCLLLLYGIKKPTSQSA